MDKFGSSPALIAFAIRKAWYFAYFILEATAGSRGPQIWQSSKKVADARKVSAVCLSCYQPLIVEHPEAVYAIPRSLIEFHRVFCSLESLGSKLINVCLAGEVINDGLVVAMVSFALIQD